MSNVTRFDGIDFNVILRNLVSNKISNVRDFFSHYTFLIFKNKVLIEITYLLTIARNKKEKISGLIARILFG